MPHYVYILRCRDNSLYTGYTSDLGRRLEQHQAGTASRCTRARLPVVLVYHEEYADQAAALRREWEIKQLSKKNKENLVKSGTVK